MTTFAAGGVVGAGIDRVDAPLKVTGSAHYPNDFSLPGMVHAALVGSTLRPGASATST
jgi:xanthine dehydrogenase YagR molybdenum-binding subunit